MGIEHCFRDGQPEPRPARSAATAPIAARESHEDPVEILRIDARSGVSNRDYRVGAVPAQSQLDLALAVGMFDGVLDHGVQRGRETVGIAFDFSLLDLPQPPFARGGHPASVGVDDDRLEVDDCLPQEVRVLRGRQHQESVDQSAQPQKLICDHPRVRPEGRVGSLTLDQLGMPQGDGDGCRKLVGGILEELATALEEP